MLQESPFAIPIAFLGTFQPYLTKTRNVFRIVLHLMLRSHSSVTDMTSEHEMKAFAPWQR